MSSGRALTTISGTSGASEHFPLAETLAGKRSLFDNHGLQQKGAKQPTGSP